MKTLVIVPLYNEVRTLSGVMTELRRHYRGDVLLVDDGSTDGSLETIDRSDPALSIIRHGENRGYGSSLIDGFDFARERGYEVAITMDCDFQHEPRHVPELIEGSRDVDVLSGSRYLAESGRDQSAPEDRRKINRLITARINEITGFGITDAFCGFKAYRVGSLAGMKLDETGYGFPLQLWVQARALGLTVREIPVDRIYQNLDRTFGSGLDDPERRLRYYESVIEREKRRWKLTS